MSRAPHPCTRHSLSRPGFSADSQHSSADAPTLPRTQAERATP